MFSANSRPQYSHRYVKRWHICTLDVVFEALQTPAFPVIASFTQGPVIFVALGYFRSGAALQA